MQIPKLYNNSVYTFTTENIDGYLNQFDLNDKDVLCVQSSYDHALECLIRGANQIDTFDINYNTKIYKDLKINALKLFDKEKFLNFLLVRNSDFFNDKDFKKLAKYLNPETKEFYQKNKYKYMIHSYSTNYEQERSLLYLQNYYQTKKKLYRLSKSNFYHCDILNLHKFLTKKYDYILLSNIKDYLNEYKFRYYIDNVLSMYLNKNGIIFSEYYYHNTIDKELLTKYKGQILKFKSLNDLKKNKEKELDYCYIKRN